MPPPRLTDYASVTEFLYALKAAGPKFGLDRMQGLAAALGNPERDYPVIHVAGTNGKGSVAAMLDAIFHAAGWRTGLYTSPHLVRLGERVQITRQLLTEDEIVTYTRELQPIAERLAARQPDERPSFFEFMTAMAFLQFKRKQVDVAIVEVGLGGRLDATNVVRPEMAVITSIGLDHCELLGDEITQVAREKAGIIKVERPVVLGRMPGEAERVIREIACERHAPVHSVREIFGETLANHPTTNLAGDYQRWNAATAALVAQLLPANWRLSADVVSRGLQQVSWPGRWQRTTIGGRSLILDASHNPEGAQSLEVNLRQLVAATGRKPVVVTGVLGEFRARALLEVLGRYAKEIHLVPPKMERACTYGQMEACTPADSRHLLRRASLEGVFPDAHRCAAGGPDDTVLVTGSIYLLGEILTRIEPARGRGEARLQDF